MKNESKKIAEVTLNLLEKKTWLKISLDEIKKKSKIKSFEKFANNKNKILLIINEYFDYKLSIGIKNIENSNNKDMIFEILMIRFDIIQNYRIGVISIYNSFKRNPKDLLFLIPSLLDSVILMISHTKIPYKNFKGQLNIKGVFIIYILTFKIWVKDSNSSMEKTMMALDGYLDQAGKLIKLIKL